MAERVVVTDHDFPDLDAERETFDRHGIDLTVADATAPAEVVDAGAGADGLLVKRAPVTAEVLAGLPDLAVVGRYGIGLDNVDLDAATDRGVRVVHVPTYCVDEVAEHALALLLACERRLVDYDAGVRDGEWDWKRGRPLRRVGGGTLGLAGFGDIARRLVEKARGLGFECVAYDPYVDADAFAARGVEPVGFEDLLDRSDAVSIHAPLTAETRGLFDADAIARLDDDAVLVNTARGEIVDVEALAAALAGGDLRAAGIDAMPEEPPSDNPLADLENAVVTPHCAWYSEGALDELQRTAAEEVARVLTGREPRHLANPAVAGE